MPTTLVIRLLPAESIEAGVFSTYLNDLTIEAHELSFADPAGSAPPFGSASYLPPVLGRCQ